MQTTPISNRDEWYKKPSIPQLVNRSWKSILRGSSVNKTTPRDVSISKGRFYIREPPPKIGFLGTDVLIRRSLEDLDLSKAVLLREPYLICINRCGALSQAALEITRYKYPSSSSRRSCSCHCWVHLEVRNCKNEGEVLPVEPLKGLVLRGEFMSSLKSFQCLPIHFFQ